ncbi:MAG: adenylyltransferase/cytidyltransferase family protein [Propionibacteriaceae bacterium]|nr:adenylyltransferase/cytidyltransferase family protein [Propionibacteriaceae bacterium]
MYEMIELDQVSQIDCAADSADLFRLAWTSTSMVILVTKAGKLVGYVTRHQVAKDYSPKKSIADYMIHINAVTVPSTCDPGDIIAIQQAVHTQVVTRFSRGKFLKYIPLVDADGHVLAAAQRRLPKSEPERWYDYVCAYQGAGPSLVGQYLHEARLVTTVAVWCDSGPASSVILRDLLASDHVRVTHIVSDFAYYQTDDVSSVGSDRMGDIDADCLLVIGGTASVPDQLRKRAPGLALLRWFDIAQLAAKWTFGTKALLDQALRLRESGVTVRVVNAPSLKNIKNPSPREQEILGDPDSIGASLLKQDPERWGYRFEPVRSDRHTWEEFVRLVLECQPATIPRHGYTINADTDNPYFHYRDGRRVVPGAPVIFHNTVWIVGDSSATNYYGDDSETIASYLQGVVNERFGPEAYRVVDMACNAQKKEETARLIDDVELVPGDQIFIIAGNNLGMEFPRAAKASGVPYYDLSHLMDRPHDFGEVFIWSGLNHLNARGQEVVGEELARIAFDSDAGQPAPTRVAPIERAPGQLVVRDAMPVQDTPEFQAYLAFLDENKVDCTGRIGAVVVNCNPFTLGHRYLVESSAKKCDFLYVLVVEEDKSVFPFADRIELVRQGTADLENVKVLPSGRFIISSLTFPDYFSKSENPTAVVDPTQDVALFARHIAKELGITVRFAGEEPLDMVTRQYNATMARVLPPNGVEFDVIARKETSGAPISASRVRALLEGKDFDGIAELVPPTTLAYLQKRYG